jgi:hypothetical protein
LRVPVVPDIPVVSDIPVCIGFGFIPGKMLLVKKALQKFPWRKFIPLSGPEESCQKRSFYYNNRSQLVINERFVEQRCVNHARAALAGYPFAYKAVHSGVNDILKGGQFFRFAKNPLSQKPPVCQSAGPQDIGAKTADYCLCFRTDYFMAEFIHIQHRKAPLFQ